MGAIVEKKRVTFKRKRNNYGRKLGRKKLINYLRSQLRSCSTHGLPYIVNTEIHWLERFFWTAWFSISLFVIFYLLSAQYSRYKDAPLVTSVEMDYFNWNVSYPAISLCPMYKIEGENFNNLVNKTLEDTGENIELQLKAISLLSIDTIGVFNFTSLNLSTSLDPKDHATLAAMVFKKFDNNSLTTSTNLPVSVETAMTEFGMCHVINSNVAVFDNPVKWNVTNYAKNNIELSVHDKDFFIQIMNYADYYKIFIHSPDEVIVSTTPSFTTKNKVFIHFGLQVWSTRISNTLKEIPINVRKCRFNNEPISKRYPVYSYSHCVLECRIKIIQQFCDCVPHFYKVLDDERVCHISELQCFVKHMNEILKFSISVETLNNISNAKDILRSPRDCGCLSSCETDTYMKDSESVMLEILDSRMRISISKYPKVRIIRDTILSVYDLILRSGGVINLCIGASIISLMEIVILIIKIISFALVSLINWIFKQLLLQLLSK